ncbi:aryl-sulfate sulfotransferase [Bacteroidota bacterium]
MKVRNDVNLILHKSMFDFKVAGDKGGNYDGEIVISDHTVIFKPHGQFGTMENVIITINASLPGWFKPFEFSFSTGAINEYDPSILLLSSDELKFEKNFNNEIHGSSVYGSMRIINGVSVPSDFPHFIPSIINDGIAEGRIFLNNWIGNPYIMILENDGTPYFYQRVEDRARDFKVQLNGMLTRRYLGNLYAFVGMDSNYTIIDTFQCANGYGTDEHELYMLQDGHYFLIALGYRNIDMSQIVSGGQTDAIVIDNHIQEFDKNHNLVFEWLSYEHFNVEDADYEDLEANWIDYVHMNSIAIDYDGHIIVSSRHLSEVTKINRQTGQIMWRFGGLNNQFNLLNDEYCISYQHFARPVEGKPNQYTIFDNGNFHTPEFSRAVEFYLDTINYTATKVWEYCHSPDRYTSWMGNAQRLSNGNTFINWADGSLPKATEVTSSGEIVYEGNFEKYIHCYRSFRYEWESVAQSPYLIVEPLPDKVTLIFNKFGDENIREYIVYAGKAKDSLIPIDTTSTPFLYLTELENNLRYYFQVTAVDNSGIESKPSEIIDVFVQYVQPGENYLKNGNFSEGESDWDLGIYGNADASSVITNDGEYHLQIINGGSEVWHVQLLQGNVPLIQGKTYVFEFDAYASDTRIVDAKLERNGSPWENYSKTNPILINRQKKHYSYKFVMEDPTDYQARVVFNCGNYDIDLFLDNISLIEEEITGINVTGKNYLAYNLINNYPNPFNQTTTIKYEIAELSIIKISVYNITGELITHLLYKTQRPGLHKIEFNALNLSSGVYFYILNAISIESSNKFFYVRKMILIK